MVSLLLTSEQIDAAEGSLVNSKLTSAQVGDLLSIFRGYLGPLAADYALEATFTAQDDSSDTSRKCAKLAACLQLFSDNQFTPDVAGFANTAANRTGFVYSLEGENYKVFTYAFGLFWDLPRQLASPNGRRVSMQGKFVYTSP